MPKMTQEELLAGLIAQKLVNGWFSLERAVWLSALEVGIKLPMPGGCRTHPKDPK